MDVVEDVKRGEFLFFVLKDVEVVQSACGDHIRLRESLDGGDIPKVVSVEDVGPHGAELPVKDASPDDPLAVRVDRVAGASSKEHYVSVVAQIHATEFGN